MDFAINLKMRGFDLKTYMETAKLTPQDIRNQFKDKALDNIVTSLILEEVGRRENVTVSDEEVEKEIEKYAEMAKKSLEDYKKSLKPEDIAAINDNILTRKIFDILIENAQITEKKVDELEPEADKEQSQEIKQDQEG